MIKKLLFLLAASAFTANASTITFQPTSQTVNLGSTATVDVYISGINTTTALGAFDFFVNNNSSIITPVSVTFAGDLGADLSFSGSTIGSSQIEAYEASNVDLATLQSLQGTQPFELFELTYDAVGVGTSALTVTDSYDDLADGSGNVLANPTVVNGSITVQGSMVTPTPEPSTLALFTGGGGVLLCSWRRRRAA